VSHDEATGKPGPVGFSAREGLATLGPDAVVLRDALDAGFLSWAADCDAESVIYPPLVEVEALA
jgi:hypothetical protein